MNKISKLFARFRHINLINAGFRVYLLERVNKFGKLDESICFEILEASKEKIKVKLWHVLYDEHVGNQCEDSLGLYEIDLTKSYNKNNVKYLGKEKYY